MSTGLLVLSPQINCRKRQPWIKTLKLNRYATLQEKARFFNNFSKSRLLSPTNPGYGQMEGLFWRFFTGVKNRALSFAEFSALKNGASE